MHKNILTVVGIIILFLGTCINPSVAIDNVKKLSMPISDGNTLYVGGTGEGNYTRIQDAINNASDGDTVFIFDDSSPYYENLTVNKSINLIGEDKKTTVIDSRGKFTTVKVCVDWVNFSGFSTKYAEGCGIYIHSNHNTIINNIISTKRSGTKSPDGIYLDKSYNNSILANSIVNNQNGITLLYSDKNIIMDNTITSNGVYGIELGHSNFNTIIGNNISSNWMRGFFMYGTEKNTITGNNIKRNGWYGIQLEVFNFDNIIHKNNFIDNGENAYFVCNLFQKHKNNWYGNYWSDYNINSSFPKIIKGRLRVIDLVLFYLPTFAFDWHPVKEPYNIEV